MPLGEEHLRDGRHTLQRRVSSIAIVGLNGAGKTTLIKLLARLYDPTEGRILCDGTDLREVDLQRYREQLSIVFEGFVQYQLRLKENAIIGSSFSYEPTWMDRVLGFLGLDRLMERMHDGVDTLLGRQFHVHGEELSGGQWQRVALARAKYRTKDASLLVLDEPTSAMNAQQEAILYDSLGEWKRDRTLILISHRLSSVRHCERIIVLDEGRVVETGDHETLMRMGGLYRQLFDTQARGYKPTAGGPAPGKGNLAGKIIARRELHTT
jgi:ATP-binding cassette, subfamily B, bacterial